MAFDQEFVWVLINGRNRKHYEDDLDYIIPKYYSPKHKKFLIKNGTKILVRVCDLPPNSAVRVLCKCDECGKIREINFNQYSPICLSCSRKQESFRNAVSARMSGKNSHCWNPDLTDNERLSNRNNIPGYQRALYFSKKRDGECIVCHSTEHLQSHHILDVKHFPELITNTDNIVTLCFDHHTAKNGESIHNIYGKHPTKENFDEFIRNHKTI